MIETTSRGAGVPFLIAHLEKSLPRLTIYQEKSAPRFYNGKTFYGAGDFLQEETNQIRDYLSPG